HRAHRDPSEVQCAALLSVKTGGCPEDCAYCPQSAHYETGVESSTLMSVDAVRDAGLDYYNHNLDTGPDFYSDIVGTRTYEDRRRTFRTVREAGMKVCCGGILGMGEQPSDRIDLLYELASQDPKPESVPINTLVTVAGTPLANQDRVPWDDLVRMVAVARILMPKTWVRLSADDCN
ncbi:MAG: radical SAM protein, partial [Vicinamibacterales bacterium]|nr:radical SAM protein [Vicinamibacterales bacterium]